MKAIGTQQRLMTLKINSLEYIPSQGLKYLRNLFLKEKDMNYLTDLEIKIETTAEEYSANFSFLNKRGTV